jgi:hypothetical protein
MRLPRNRSHTATANAIALAVAWLAYLGVLQWSVVRFRVPIVLTLTACAVLLALWLATRARVAPTPWVAALVPVGSVALTLVVPLFSYLRGGPLTAAVGTLVVGSVAAGSALFMAGGGQLGPAAVRRCSRLALGVACMAYAVTVAIAVLGDPAPRIDVWVTLQQASDALARGQNFYAMTWTGSPGIQDAFTYLPWAAVLLAPGRWLAGDVRWALGVWMLVAAAAFWRLATPRRSPVPAAGAPRGQSAPAGATAVASTARPHPAWIAAVAAVWLLLAPGTLTQIDQAWTEPLLLAGLGWWAVLVSRGRAWWAVLPLALACASKQHLALLLPLVMLWRPFGFRRAVATGALTGLLIAPWFLASPADFVHDTVTLLIGFHPIRFANTWYLLALNEYGITLPFWLTGLVVLGTLGGSAWVVWRRQPPTAELLRWLALVLLAANLVNKQAFYNQYWLSAALVALSIAAPASPSPRESPGRTASAP